MIWSIKYQNGIRSDSTEYSPTLPISAISSFGEDSHGELYIVSLSGTVYKIVPEGGSSQCDLSNCCAGMRGDINNSGEPDGQNIMELWDDFIDAIESRRKPVSDIEIGHRSTTMSLLGILSWKLGRSVKWDGEKEYCPGDPEANALLRRDYRQPWMYPAV